MYLWLKLIFDVLQQQLKTTEKHLLRVIDELPETVDQAYEAVLNRIPKNEVERAKKLLAIVLVAERPLHVQELNIALAIDEDPTQDSLSGLDMETESSFRSRLGNVCGSFVTVVDSRVYLIHQTARSFLSSIKKTDPCMAEGPTSRWKGSIRLSEAHLLFGRIYVNYLLLRDFERNLHPSVTRHRWNPQYYLRSRVTI